MNKLLSVGVVVSLLLMPAVSLAAVFQDGKNSFELEAPLTDDLYVAGERVDIGQTVSEDLFAAGERIEVTADMGADVYAVGSTVIISGAVADDVHAAGQDVEVGGSVRGDVFAAGRNVQFTNEAEVAKDVYAAGENVMIEGSVSGTVRAAGKVTVGSEATITGDLFVYGNEQPTIEEGATIGGAVTVKEYAEPEKPARSFFLLGWVRSVLSLAALSMVLIYGARRFSRDTIATVGQGVGKPLLTGAIWYLLFIPVSILLLITLVGIPLAFGLILLTMLMCLAATGIAAAGLGRWVLSKVSSDPGTDLTWVHALVGAVIYKAVQMVPVIGWLAAAALVTTFFGAAILTLLKTVRTYEPSSGVNQNPGTGLGAA